MGTKAMGYVKCQDYEPWNDESDIVLIDECSFFSPVEMVCLKVGNQHYNQPCPWDGYPNEEE